MDVSTGLRCPFCKGPLDLGDKVCYSCGKPLPVIQNPTVPSKIDQIASLLSREGTVGKDSLKCLESFYNVEDQKHFYLPESTRLCLDSIFDVMLLLAEELKKINQDHILVKQEENKGS